MARAMRSMVLCAALLTAGCEPKAEPPPVPDERAPDTAAATASASPVDPCIEAAAEFARVLDAASGSCDSDDDCRCYPAGIGERAGCGGVTDRQSAATLDEVAKRFRTARCPYARRCAPWHCVPACVQGRCEKGQRAPAKPSEGAARR